MVYSNSVRTGPRLRLLSAIVATSFAIRTLALLPLLFAISPSRIRTLRTTAVFQPSFATKNLRSISRVMTKVLSFRLRDTHTAAPPPSGVRQPSGGRTTQNSTPIQAFLPRSADMRTAIWRDHMVDLVIWNRRPLAVDFDFVVVADHTALSRATVHEVTAGAFAVVSVQLRVEALMPFVVACAGIPLLRRAAHTKRHGERSAEQRDELASLHSITSSASDSRLWEILIPSAFAVLRLMTDSNLLGSVSGRSPGLAPLRICPS